MDKGDIRLINTIVHIMDSSIGMPVFSDLEIDNGVDLSEFIREHIYKVMSSDEVKKCSFIEGESEVKNTLESFNVGDINFLDMSKDIAEKLYDVMVKNVDIPSADLFINKFEISQRPYLSILKMNYRESFTHNTINDGTNNINSIIRYRSILPTEGQKLSEAAVVNLEDMSILLIEKKYEVNGAKTEYFSKIFLKCNSKLSQKAKLNIVEKAVESVQKEFFSEDEQFEEKMKVKAIIHKEIEEQGELDILNVSQKIFENKVNLKEKFIEKIEKYNIKEDEVIKPKAETLIKKYEKQHLTTDTGIEIKIPMEQYNSTDNIEFITGEDGTISVLIKNIGKITSK